MELLVKSEQTTRGKAVVLNIETGEMANFLVKADADASFGSFAYSHDGELLAAAGSSGITEWDVSTSALVKSYIHEQNETEGLHYHPLMEIPQGDDGKLEQVIRWLEARCTYKAPALYDCTS